MKPLIPILVAVGSLVVLPAEAMAQSSNQPAVLGGQGRYVFGQINEFNADQYMLDTQTGRLWRLVDTADGGGSVLEAVLYTLPSGATQTLPPDGSEVEIKPAPAPTAEDLLPLRPDPRD